MSDQLQTSRWPAALPPFTARCYKGPGLSFGAPGCVAQPGFRASIFSGKEPSCSQELPHYSRPDPCDSWVSPSHDLAVPSGLQGFSVLPWCVSSSGKTQFLVNVLQCSCISSLTPGGGARKVFLFGCHLPVFKLANFYYQILFCCLAWYNLCFLPLFHSFIAFL